MSESSREGKRIEGKHVLLGLIAFFGAILIVNGVFLYFALATFGGGDASSPYQRGLRYNQTIAEAAQLAERGWEAKLAYDKERSRIALELRDRQDQPVRGLQLVGTVGRPATDRQDMQFTFEQTEPGTYVAALDLGAGQWVLQLHSKDVSRGGDPSYRLKRRLFVEARP